jgi:hypothetical protein
MLRRRVRKLLVESLEMRRLLAAVSIPDNIPGAPSAVVTAPVNIDTAAGIRGATIQLQYDTSILNLTTAGVVAGSVWAGNADTQVTANVNDAAGTVTVFISSASDLPAGAGSLVQFQFTVVGTAAAGTVAALDLTNVVLNEQAIPVTPAPVPGVDPTDGSILVTITPPPPPPVDGDGSIAGFVYADANFDGQLSVGEAIPNVLITLTNSGTGAQLQTRTGLDGSYRFEDLPAGSYQIQQTQPAAFIDGGNNTLNVTLAADASLVNQDFVEVGLLPQFVYMRLLSTTVMPVGSTPWQTLVGRIQSDAEAGRASAPVAPAQIAIANPPSNGGSSSVTATPSPLSLRALLSSSFAPVVQAAPLVQTTRLSQDRFQSVDQAVLEL